MEFHARWLKTRVVFWGPHDGRQHFGVQIPPKKPSKVAFYKHVRASANGLKTNDVIEDWCHWLAVARGGRAAYTIYSILEITAAVFTTQAIVSADALYSARKFSFCKIYTVYVGILLNRLAHKKIPYAVCWKASKTFETDKQAADIRRYSN